MTVSPPPPPDRYAVIGYPVAHSRSPFIHARFAEETGEAIEYGRIEAPPETFDQVLDEFAAGGGRGCNITVPFKFSAFRRCPRVTPRAALAEAANVLCLDGHDWLADNSDGIGLVRDIEQGASRPLAGQRVLLIGAGGAAAGVLGPLIECRPSTLVVVNRTADKASALVLRHAHHAADHACDLQARALDDAGRGYDIVINATASSLGGAASPVADDVLRPGSLAVDLMYGPSADGFLRWAQAHGAEGRDGLGMLVEQAAEAFALWRGVRPSTAPVLLALREVLAAEAAAACG